jgi:hypothetical protein
MLNKLITFRTYSTEITEINKTSVSFNPDDIKVVFVKSKKMKRRKEERTMSSKSDSQTGSILKNKKFVNVKQNKKVTFSDKQLVEVVVVPSYKEHFETNHEENNVKSSKNIKCNWSCLII